MMQKTAITVTAGRPSQKRRPAIDRRSDCRNNERHTMKRMLCILLLCTLLSGCAATGEKALAMMTVSVLGVGKADCTFFYTEGFCVVIDCAESDNTDTIGAFLENTGIKTIDCLIISHFDKDHIGGAPELLSRCAVKCIYEPDYEEKSNEYQALTAAAAQQGIPVRRLTADTVLHFDGLEIKLSAPQRSQYGDDNDYSLIAGLYYSEISLLFPGDALDDRLGEYLSGQSETVDFLKLPHHGSYSERTAELIKTVKPDYAVITCSQKNPPDNRTIALLDEIGSRYYKTGKKTVTVKTDGRSLITSQ